VLAAPRAAAVWQWLLQRYPDSHLSLDTSPQLDLKIDSLEWVALTVDLERQLEVTLRAEQLARILTLRDLLREVDAASASIATAPPPAPAAFVKPGAALRALGALLLFTVRAAVRLLLRPTATGIDRLPEGPVLITPNHASYLDPLVIAAALPWRQLRRTYWAGWVGVMHTSPLRRLVSRATQVFPVDADRDLTAAVRTAQELLREGHNVVWFPEGRRSPDGRLQPFQPGVGAVLQGAAAAVVPAAITGAFAAWPKQRRWPRFAPVAVTFGEPLTIDGSQSPAAVGSMLERAVEKLLGSSSNARRTTDKEKIA
jgi:long-chain acyl-CoA synthetase